MNAAPGPEPEPPDDLAQRDLPLRILEDATLFRGHKRAYGPLHFNREAGRFLTSEGTLYLGTEPHGAFVEAFSSALVASRTGYVVSQGLLERSCLCVVMAQRPLRLVDLTSSQALKRLSVDADSRISTGTHAMSQRWARAFWSHPERPDGLIYPCRRAPETQSVALFARVESDLVAACNPNLLRNPDQLVAILDHYAIALVP